MAVQEFLIGMIGSRPIEIAAVVLGLLNVWLITQRSVWNYPFGLVMVVLYGKIFYDYALYSDALLQAYFFAIQLYGLANWLAHRAPDGAVVVQRASGRVILLSALFSVIGAAVLGAAMARYTDAAFPYWDATIASLSVVAQFLLSRRLLENWVVWILVDLLAIALFWIKELEPTAALYVVFLALAIFGLLRWSKAYARGETV